MTPGRSRSEVETARRPLLATLAAGGAAGLAGCSVVTDRGPVGGVAAAQEVTYLGRKHTALGDAVLDLQNDGSELLVDNLGSGGDDGVRVHLDSVEKAVAFFDGIALPNDGNGFVAKATGTTSSSESSCLGNGGCKNNGGTVQASAGFSCIGSSTVKIVVWDGDTLVGSDVVSGGGTVARVDPGPNGAPQIVACGNRVSGSNPPGFLIELDVLAEITTSSGDTFVGDRVGLLAADPDVSVDAIDELDLFGTELGSFTIVDEKVQ